MILALQLIIGLALGAAIGLGSALFAVDRGLGFEAVRVGAWSAWPRSGAANADPYTRANLSRTGDLPLAGGTGISFTATADDTGQALRANCDYLLSGRMPATQWWTLTVYSESGRHLIENPVHRLGINSGEVVRRPDGSFEVTVSQRARPGNWLPVGEAGEVRYVVRLYDTPVATGRSFQDIRMPSIQRTGCRS
ncbi:MAG: DUF1214 domain-containing protein [Flavobacteriaceae bacterium]